MSATEQLKTAKADAVQTQIALTKATLVAARVATLLPWGQEARVLVYSLFALTCVVLLAACFTVTHASETYYLRIWGQV